MERPMDRLTFAVLSDSLAEVRRVPARCGRETAVTVETLARHFTVWERGVLLNAALFLIDFPRSACEIPYRAYAVARQVVRVEAAHGYLEELLAAAMAGAPWKSAFDRACLRCGQPGTWRAVLSNAELPPEVAWRYDRPENHVPICRRCVTRQLFRRWEVQFELARGLWGPRFTPLLRWHHALENRVLPADWDRAAHPLWPASFGGSTWRRGSGSLACSEPRPYHGVARSAAQRERLSRFLGEARVAELLDQNARAREDWLLWSPGAADGAALGVG